MDQFWDPGPKGGQRIYVSLSRQVVGDSTQYSKGPIVKNVNYFWNCHTTVLGRDYNPLYGQISKSKRLVKGQVMETTQKVIRILRPQKGELSTLLFRSHSQNGFSFSRYLPDWVERILESQRR